MKVLVGILAISGIMFLASCTGYSKYPISEKGTIKVDEHMFGIWKAVEDTNKSDFILIQSADDAHYYLSEILRDFGSMKRYEEYLDSFTRAVTGDDRSYPTDTGATINYLTEEEKKNEKIKDFNYWVTWFDHNGKNPHYQQWDMHEDRIGKARFFSSEYRHMERDAEGHFISPGESGFLTYRLLKTTEDSLVVCVVSDPGMKDLPSSAAVRKKIEKNINNKAFYSDTVHFYKVKAGHFGLNKSMELANK
jgi:hypothetical protein